MSAQFVRKTSVKVGSETLIARALIATIKSPVQTKSSTRRGSRRVWFGLFESAMHYQRKSDYRLLKAQ